MGRIATGWAAGLSLVILAGCATSSGPAAHFAGAGSGANVFVAPGNKHVTKVAILPFKAPTELIGQSVSDMFLTESLRAGKYEVVERSQMAQVLGETELSLSGMTTAQAVQAGTLLGADAVMMGTVDEYGTTAQRGSAYPVVGISARLVDCGSGKIIWSVDLAKRASSGSTTLSQHARAVVHEMMAALYREWNR